MNFIAKNLTWIGIAVFGLIVVSAGFLAPVGVDPQSEEQAEQAEIGGQPTYQVSVAPAPSAPGRAPASEALLQDQPHPTFDRELAELTEAERAQMLAELREVERVQEELRLQEETEILDESSFGIVAGYSDEANH